MMADLEARFNATEMEDADDDLPVAKPAYEKPFHRFDQAVQRELAKWYDSQLPEVDALCRCMQRAAVLRPH